MPLPAVANSGLRRACRLWIAVKCGCPSWVQVIAPAAFARGDVHFFCLGARAGAGVI